MEVNQETHNEQPVMIVAADITDTMRTWYEEQQRNQERHQNTIQSTLGEMTTLMREMTATIGTIMSTCTEQHNLATTTHVNRPPLATTNLGETRNGVSVETREVVAPNTPAPASSISPVTPWNWPAIMEKAGTSLPKFKGENNEIHPVRFLEALEKYFLRLQIPAEQKLEVTLECLVGDATNWAEMYVGFWTNFEDFKIDFLHSFWSQAKQNKLRLRVSTERWEARKSPSMMSHLASYVSQTKMLNIPIPEEIFVDEMIRHFPVHIQSLWQASDKATIKELAEFLRKQEATTRIVHERKVTAALITTTIEDNERGKVAEISEALKDSERYPVRNKYRKVNNANSGPYHAVAPAPTAQHTRTNTGNAIPRQ